MKSYEDVFTEVRQRVAAFNYWKEYTNQERIYGMTEDFYLDEAYRFLYVTASKGFMKFCAEKEGMSLPDYCAMLGIAESELL